MPTTYEAIATVTVGSGGASTIDFTSIPNTFTDLLIKYSLRTSHSSVADDLLIRFNSDTTNNYTYRRLFGNGSSAISDNATSNFVLASFINAANATSSTFGNGEIYIPNYTSSNRKTTSSDAVAETNASTQFMAMIASIWNGTSAITSIQLIGGSANFVQHSTATLYGIKNT